MGEIRMGEDWARRLLPLLAEGKSNEEMAQVLILSPLTVKHYLGLLYAWMGVDNRVQAVVEGISRGWCLPGSVAIGITDEAISAVADAIRRGSTPKVVLAAGVTHLRIVPVKASRMAVDKRTPPSEIEDTGQGCSIAQRAS